MSVDYVSQDGVGVITLHRPPANSYESSFVTELGEAVDAASSDTAVIVRSGLDKFFSAGADVKAFAEGDPEGNVGLARQAHGVLDAMAAARPIFIAEIAGHALGGGLEIALGCDLRFGAEGSYRLGLPEVTLGLLPGTGGTQRLPRLIGRGRALDRMLTGATMTPQEAHDLGLLDRLMPADELGEQTMAYARELADGAPLAIASIKQAVVQGMDLPLHEALSNEIDLVAPLFASEDGREGMQAFMEKRKPRFTGR